MKLRLVDEQDLDFVRELRQDPEVVKYLGSFILLNQEKQIQWFKSLINDKSKMYLILEDDNEKFGYVRITKIDYIHRSVCVGGDIHKDCRGKGLSSKMFELIFDLCFNKMNMNRVWLFVLETNERAIHIYKKNGFVEEGRQRKAIYKDGKYLDYIMMSILKDEYYNKKEIRNGK